MIGVVVGVVLAAIVFTLNTKDEKAVREHQENKKKEEEKKQKAEKEQKEALEKIRNDPATKKRREENDKKMREKLFDGISESDRKLLEEYLDSKKNTGKSEAEIVKDATGKAGIFVLLMLLVLVGSVFAIVFLVYEGDTSKITNGVQKLLTSVYPKFNNMNPSSNNEL